MKGILTSLLIASLFTCLSCFGQNERVDSLTRELKVEKPDSAKVNDLIELCREYCNIDPEIALNFGNRSKSLAEKIDYKPGLAKAYKYTGIAYFNQGNYLEALQQYELSLEVFKKIADKKGVANMYSNIGNVYFNKGDDVKSLDLYFQSLKISEEIADTLRIVTALSNIGAVYTNKKATYRKSLEYLLKAYPLSVAINDGNSTGNILVNIGEIYLKENLIDSAIYYLKKSLEASEGTENAPYILTFLGKAYTEKGEYEEAITHQKKAIEIAKGLEMKDDLAIALQGLAQTYQKKGDIKPALTTFLETEPIFKETENNYKLKETYEGLAGIYSQLSDFGKAYKYQSLLLNVKDSIYNIDTDKKLGGLAFDFAIFKKEGQINLLTKDQEIQKQEIRRQKLVRNGFVGGFAVVLMFAGVFFTQRNRISKEKKRSDELLLNILPAETAEELKATGTAKAKSFDMVSVMFTDFKNFTQASEKLSAEDLVQEINYCYSEFDRIITKYGIEKIKTIGDAYMCAGGLPVTNNSHPVDVIKAGLEFQEFIEKNKEARIKIDQPYFELRLGIHTGPVVAGIVGIKKFAYDIWGDTVNTASRMESSGEIGKVNISEATYELVKDKFICTSRGKIKAKNKGEIEMYFVERIL